MRSIKIPRSYWRFFNNWEAASLADAENSPMKAMTRRVLVLVGADSTLVTCLLGYHKLFMFVSGRIIFRVSNKTGFVRRYKWNTMKINHSSSKCKNDRCTGNKGKLLHMWFLIKGNKGVCWNNVAKQKTFQSIAPLIAGFKKSEN